MLFSQIFFLNLDLTFRLSIYHLIVEPAAPVEVHYGGTNFTCIITMDRRLKESYNIRNFNSFTSVRQHNKLTVLNASSCMFFLLDQHWRVRQGTL